MPLLHRAGGGPDEASMVEEPAPVETPDDATDDDAPDTADAADTPEESGPDDVLDTADDAGCDVDGPAEDAPDAGMLAEDVAADEAPPVELPALDERTPDVPEFPPDDEEDEDDELDEEEVSVPLEPSGPQPPHPESTSARAAGPHARRWNIRE